MLFHYCIAIRLTSQKSSKTATERYNAFCCFRVRIIIVRPILHSFTEGKQFSPRLCRADNERASRKSNDRRASVVSGDETGVCFALRVPSPPDHFVSYDGNMCERKRFSRPTTTSVYRPVERAYVDKRPSFRDRWRNSTRLATDKVERGWGKTTGARDEKANVVIPITRYQRYTVTRSNRRQRNDNVVVENVTGVAGNGRRW